ncbi:MAG: NAD(P)-binding oxidoreductase [Ardenticatenales bacterium]
MHIALFGATGGTGQQIAVQARAAGHSVTALVRDPSRLEPVERGAASTGAAMTIVAGDVLDPGAVAQIVAGVDAVLVALGTTKRNPPDIVSSGTAVIIDAMKAAGIKRLIVVSSLGVGDSWNEVPWLFKLARATFLRTVMADKAIQEQLVRESGLEWTILRPGGLTNGPLTDRTDLGTQAPVMAGRISRADVAAMALRVAGAQGTVRRVLSVT